MTNIIIPLLFAIVVIYGVYKKINVFDIFIEGAKDGLSTSVRIIPALVALMTCVGMFKASGGIDIIISLIEPITSFFNIPREIIPLALLRPISGSGALVIYEDILKNYGADSFLARTASVLMGSTETTFYTIAVYYGATNIKNARHTALCALTADITGFLLSGFLVALFLG